MNGLAFPLQAHLSDPRITHFANPALPDANGNSVSSILNRLPALKWMVPGLMHNERHLVYPPTARRGAEGLRRPVELPRQDLDLVRVGRHPAERRHRQARRPAGLRGPGGQARRGRRRPPAARQRADAHRGALRPDQERPAESRTSTSTATAATASCAGHSAATRRLTSRTPRRCPSTSTSSGELVRRRHQDPPAGLHRRARAPGREVAGRGSQDAEPAVHRGRPQPAAARLRRQLVHVHALVRRRHRQPADPVPGVLALARPSGGAAEQPRDADAELTAGDHVPLHRDRPQPRRPAGALGEGRVLPREPVAGLRHALRDQARRRRGPRPGLRGERDLDRLHGAAVARGHRCLFARVFSFSPLDLPLDDYALSPVPDRHIAQLNLNIVANGDKLLLDWFHLPNADEQLELVPMTAPMIRALRLEARDGADDRQRHAVAACGGAGRVRRAAREGAADRGRADRRRPAALKPRPGGGGPGAPGRAQQARLSALRALEAGRANHDKHAGSSSASCGG